MSWLDELYDLLGTLISLGITFIFVVLVFGAIYLVCMEIGEM